MRCALLLLLSLIALASQATDAGACINDRETRKREQEFKSDYRQDGPPPASSEPGVPDAYDVRTIVIDYPKATLGLAGAMALGGVTLGLTRTRRKS